MTEIETRWTVPQAFVWIRSRNLVTARKFDEPALTMAELTLSGAFDASDCLRVIGYLMEALRLSDASRPLGTGLCSKSRRANRLSDPGRRATKPISASDLAERGNFTDVPNAASWLLCRGRQFVGSTWTVNADDCTRRALAGARASIFSSMAACSAEALDLLEPEDCPPWFLAHPDVATTGLDYAGAERFAVARRVFEGPFGSPCQ